MAGRNQDELTFQFRQSNTPAILTDVREGISELGLCSYMEDQPEILLLPGGPLPASPAGSSGTCSGPQRAGVTPGNQPVPNDFFSR